MVNFVVRRIDNSQVYNITAGTHADAREKAEREIRRVFEAAQTDGGKVSGSTWKESETGNWFVDVLGNDGAVRHTTRYNLLFKTYKPSEPVVPQVATPDAPATAAQMNYLRKLGRQVPSTTAAHWIKDKMTKGQASRAISALEDIAIK
jgi:hypothetical protein